ncbi:MAG: hypothetical protein K6G20_12930 [Ruminococcus sp.]|nr:hypothetical protein [Ruminococcus sp.]
MNTDAGYVKIKKLIEAKISTSPKFRALFKRIKSGNTTFKDTAEYSRLLSELYGKTFSDNVLDLESASREEVSTMLLHDTYDSTNDVLGQVQTILDKKKNINIRPQKAPFPAERVKKFSHSLQDVTVPDSTIKRRARSGTENITMSFHDDYMKENAEFRSKAGLKCYITRTTDGTCCEWCTKVAGRYEFGSQPEDIFRRHDHCNCEIDYDGQKLRGEMNGNSKKWVEVPAEGAGAEPPKVLTRAESAVLSEKNKPVVFTQEQARKLNNEKLNEIFVNKPSIDNSGGSGIILGRGSGAGNPANTDHTFEKIGEVDFGDKKAVAKSLQEFEQKYKDSMIEHCRIFCTNGEVYEVHGDLDTVGTTLLGDKLKGSINEHNHVTGRSQYSFSWDDIKTSVEDGSSIVMAFDEKYRYSMVFSGEKIDLDEIEQVYIDCDNEVGDINALSWQSKKIKPIKEEDYQHEVVRRVCERFGVKYERKRKA